MINSLTKDADMFVRAQQTVNTLSTLATFLENKVRLLLGLLLFPREFLHWTIALNVPHLFDLTVSFHV